ILFQYVQSNVGRRRGESVFLQKRTNLSRRPPEVSGELDLLVSDRSDLGERARHIRLHQIADCIELEADLFQLSVRDEDRARRGVTAGDSEGGHSECSEEVATSLHCQSTGVRSQLVWRTVTRSAMKGQSLSHRSGNPPTPPANPLSPGGRSLVAPEERKQKRSPSGPEIRPTPVLRSIPPSRA